MKFGIDPEFFVLNQSNQPINAYKVCKSTKNKPIKIYDINIYHDNVLLEANCDPVLTEGEFLISSANLVAAILENAKGYKISLDSFFEFSDDELTGKNAKEFGCDPDYDAYTLTINDTATKEIAKTNFRTAGGHIHIGGNTTDVVCDPLMKPMFVYMLDLFVGIPSVLIDNSTQTYRRRKYFGAAGCHRDKPYGLEYRVLSPFWLRSASCRSLFYNLCNFVFHEMNDNLHKKFINFSLDKLKGNNPETAYDCYGYDCKGVVSTINNCDRVMARKFFNFASNFMPNNLIQHIEHESNTVLSPYLT